MIANATDEAVAAQAMKWVGTPFAHQGRVRGPAGGVDCVGLPIGVAEELGIELPIGVYEALAYPSDPSSEELMRVVSLACEPVEVLMPGRVAVFWWVHPTRPKHVGIVVEGGFVHARNRLSGKAQVELHPWSLYFREHLHSVWRYAWRA